MSSPKPQQQLTLTLNRYPPPSGPHYDETIIEKRLEEAYKSIDASPATPDLTACCPHCWKEKHKGDGMQCSDACGLCHQNHAAPCPGLYCTQQWWDRIWDIYPPSTVQVKPTVHEEEVLESAGVLTTGTGKKGKKTMTWNIEPLHSDPVRLAHTPVRWSEAENAMHDGGMHTALQILNWTAHLPQDKQDDAFAGQYLSRTMRELAESCEKGDGAAANDGGEGGGGGGGEEKEKR